MKGRGGLGRVRYTRNAKRIVRDFFFLSHVNHQKKLIDIQPSGCAILRSAFLVEAKVRLLLRVVAEGHQKYSSSDNMCDV